MDKKRIRFSIIGIALLLITAVWIMLFFSSDKKEYVNLTIEADTGKELCTSKTALDKGVYVLNLQYHTDLDVADVVDVFSESAPDSIRSNTTFLYQGLDEFTYNFWVDQKCDDVQVKITKADGSQLAVNQVSFCKTKLGIARTLVWVWVTLVMIGLFLIAGQSAFQKGVELRKKVAVTGILIAIALISSIPVFKEGILTGVDVGFHLLRIEGMKDALSIGQIPVRIQPNWLQGHGYANGLFYSDLFLILPAALRLCGYTVTESYKIYQFFINLLTCFVAYYSFSRMTEGKGKKTSDCAAAILATFMYATAIYRIIYLYSVEGVGQYTSLAFYPLVALGIWSVLKGEDKGCIPLALGFSGLIQSHVLSVLLMLIFAVIFALAFVKKIVIERRYVGIGQAILLCAGLNCWFILPAGMVSRTMQLQVLKGAATENRIQTWGMSLGELFTVFPKADLIGSLPKEMGTADEIHYTIGVGFTIVLIAGLILIGLTAWRKTMERFRLRIGIVIQTLTVISLYMSTYYFPWDTIEEKLPFMGKVVATIQYPVRFQSVTILLLSCLLLWEYYAMGQLKLVKTEITVKVVYGALIVIGVLVTSGYFIYSVTTEMGHIYIHDEKCMGNGIVINGEYLPLDTDINQLKYNKFAYNEQDITIGSTRHDLGKVTINVTDTKNDTEVEVPLLYYPGYVAKATDAKGIKTDLKQSVGTNGVIQISVPKGFSGNIGVWYKEPLLWRLSELVSIVTLIYLISSCTRKNRSIKD